MNNKKVTAKDNRPEICSKAQIRIFHLIIHATSKIKTPADSNAVE
ncbi:hypothetical protein POX_a01461 [Penicillium oxalicum]|nr:hypothetical protein POX_a01461 [Penicillium oxalicum]KAI2794860.1 hypothetical protein POX_a01461 [Penicillium oxalicum]